MKTVLKLEELTMFAISIYALYLFKVEWWVYLLLLLGPDISMVGYAAGNKIGAFSYNLFHHKGVAILLFIAGLYMHNILFQEIGIILFGHSSWDRMMGYGLKYEKGFKFTHLGIIGKNSELKNG